MFSAGDFERTSPGHTALVCATVDPRRLSVGAEAGGPRYSRGLSAQGCGSRFTCWR